MGNIPIEPDDGRDTAQLPKKLVEEIKKLVESLPEPMMLTISTYRQCVVITNNAMLDLDIGTRSHIYMTLNTVLVDELA